MRFQYEGLHLRDYFVGGVILGSAVILGDDGGEDTCRFSKPKLEWGEAGGRVYRVHNVESYFWKCLDPSFLVPLDSKSDCLNDHLICPFARPIGFGVVRC